MLKLQVVERSTEFSCGSYGPLAISVWDRPATEPDARAASQLLRTLSTTRSEVLVLAILGPNTPPAGSEIRDIIGKALQDLGPKLRGSATVVEGQGFRAAALRAALLGMSMVVRSSHPQKTFATVGEAAAFLSTLSDELRESNIVQAVTQLREH
jgi:hypothetical protein